ncbi:hypothetical protein MELLADRAFT_90069 [Melampsora larici-populina 98AG31]|uniref:Uncharacterized protein n=1 Tax=Melampsora larici-populina (strain 98AG31 / pathotype 3-4-7) TaxID=747676 RepID=F4RVL1_MELLP|nr:hypothetical protein MELLADRAFT_90069 [Melampsora larici-populina 98AG31]
MSARLFKSFGFSRIVKDTLDATEDRLTHVQLLLPWNPSPLQSSRIPLEYLLLPPRSALKAAPLNITFIRPLSCYTLLSGFRLPWPPCGCLDELTPFVVSDKCIFRHLNSAFGSSHIASSAYQKWPTKDFYSCTSSIKKQEPATRWFD